MILDRVQNLDDAAAYERLETNDFVAIWTGFLFLRGFVAGRESVHALLELLAEMGPAQALALPKGSFLLCILDKQAREIFCTVDPFGLMRLFVADSVISDDLFALIRQLGSHEAHLDLPALASFLRFGFYSLGRTIDRRVRVLAGDEITLFSSSGDLKIFRKHLPDFRVAPDPFDFDAYVRDVRKAICGQRVSLDLTGGYDSRLLAACLKNSAIVECATTGQPGNLDVEIARKVAAALKLPHFTAAHDVAGLEERASTLLRLTHGQMGLLTYDHIYQLTRERQRRGIDLCVAGIGGELWKDILWLQDFPFLAGPPNFERLYRTRFEPRAPAVLPFDARFARSFEGAGRESVAAMHEQFARLARTAANDCVYAFQRIPYTAGPSVTAGIRAGLPAFCPLFDLDGVIASIHKPPRERLFSRWHRGVIARTAPEVANLRTDDGLSARSGASGLLDLPFYVGNKVLRIAQKLVQRLGLPDVRRISLDDPKTLETARALGMAGPALRRLRDAHVLARDRETVQFSRALFDRLLTSGMTIIEISAR